MDTGKSLEELVWNVHFKEQLQGYGKIIGRTSMECSL